MSIRLFCADVDGTLIKDDGTISARTLTALRALGEHGVTFAISSGRAFRSLEILSAAYGLRCPVVCNNGGVVYDPDAEETLTLSPLSAEEIAILEELKQRFDLIIGLNAVDQIAYSGRDGTESEIYENQRRLFAEKAGMDLPITYSPDYRERIGEKAVCKVSFWSKDDETHEALREALSGLPQFTITSAMPHHFEVTRKGLTKWAGIRLLMERRGLGTEEVACIGDSMNDYEMIRGAGYGIAMGNSVQALKDIAAFVTESNEKEGLSRAVEYCLTL